MIERRNRDRAANLVEQLRDGRLSNLDFEAQWPHSANDRALNAISSLLWHYYDDLYEHWLTEAHALSGEALGIFNRCALFLSSDLEYLWPRDDFYGGGVDTSSGLLGLSDRCCDFPDCDPEDTGFSGDVAVWPFLNATEYNQIRRSHDDFEPGERRDVPAPSGF